MCVDSGGLGLSHRAGPGNLKLIKEDNIAFEPSNFPFPHGKMSRIYFHGGGTRGHQAPERPDWLWV